MKYRTEFDSIGKIKVPGDNHLGSAMGADRITQTRKPKRRMSLRHCPAGPRLTNTMRLCGGELSNDGYQGASSGDAKAEYTPC